MCSSLSASVGRAIRGGLDKQLHRSKWVTKFVSHPRSHFANGRKPVRKHCLATGLL